MRIGKQQRDWDDMSLLDPLWAILSYDEKRSGAWDLQEFMASGQDEISELMERARTLGHPLGRRRALDFGCGAGRLTRALAEYFDEAVGVDISSEMVEYGRRLNADIANCCFLANPRPDLSAFDDGSFDLVYTRLVLQHVPGASTILGYIREFVRVLTDNGLLAFQLPTHLPLKHRFQPRPRLYSILRRAGLSRGALYGHLGLHPIRMSFVPAADVEAALADARGRILEVDRRVVTGNVTSSTYFVTR